MAMAAGPELAGQVRDALVATRPDLAVVDCMLPAAVAAGRATDTPTASLVHFLYGLARSHMLQGGGAWTTDLEALNEAHRALGLVSVADGLSAWEAADLVLVTAPGWFDIDLDYPPNVLHAGPLGVDARGSLPERERRGVLVAFSTTVIDAQVPTLQRVCDALVGTDIRATLTLGPAVDGASLRMSDHIHALPWVDHDRLLPTCAAAITHGGLGTTLRALAHGVPLVLLPLGRDQHFNAARVADVGAGLRLAPEAAPGQIRAALEAVLNEPSFREAAASAAARIAAAEPDRRAGEALERCADRAAGGSAPGRRPCGPAARARRADRRGS
jgi:UDP:flavonoid glycosyltransferase YjiC (YdhE family)